ncbi:MAG: YjbH domain-containing protein [Chlamydiota bacterium]
MTDISGFEENPFKRKHFSKKAPAQNSISSEIRAKINFFMRALIGFFWAILGFVISLGAREKEISPLFSDLTLVDQIDAKVADRLPYHYNYALMGGYWNMPSARMTDVGMTALGFSYVPPYRNYAFTLQALSRVEFGANYRIYIGMPDPMIGKMGFGDFADRGANVKFALLKREDGFPFFLPELAVGFEDFFGTKRFHSFYAVATYSFHSYHLEVTGGWGKGRMKGFFGGVGWTPFRNSKVPGLNRLTLLAEWDAIDYKHWGEEHPKGRDVKSRINIGASVTLFDILQLNASTLRGKEVAASVSLYYNLGQSKGLLPKVNDPPLYTSPVNLEPIGYLREERELAQELVTAFFEQGMNLYRVDLKVGVEKELWMKLINLRYREEPILKERIERILAALVPMNISSTSVVVEADGIPTHAYRFRTADLERWREDKIGDTELQILAPMQEPIPPPSQYEGAKLYRRRKKVWALIVRPRVITFFGSATGKFQYSIGVLAGSEGYLWDRIYYKVQGAYHITSSMENMADRDLVNPSKLLNVRSDTVRYFQRKTVALEEAYFQHGFYMGRGWYGRVACGYFEPAYAGGAIELLYYPVSHDWAIGLEAAGVFKRNYRGLGLTTEVRKFTGTDYENVHFIGYQYFLDLYYDFKPLQLEFKASIGRFLARDFGVHFEVGRYYSSGFRFSVWYDWTSARDIVNGSRYRNKGIAFSIPLDFFLKKSSRSTIGYILSAWLRDTGARAATGKRLQPTLQNERTCLPQ